MEITTVSIQGFKCFTVNRVFDFTTGLNCLQGRNGAGKTSTIEAMCCLLGQTSRAQLRYTYAIRRKESPHVMATDEYSWNTSPSLSNQSARVV